MRRRGMVEEEILAALRAVNEARCDPPLSDEEVQRIASSVAGYEPEDPVAPKGIDHPTDLGNAKRLVARHGEDIRYVFSWGKWLVWDGHRWTQDDTGEVSRRAKQTVIGMYAEAKAGTDPDTRKAKAKHAMSSEAEPRMRAMVTHAQSEPGIWVRPADLDADSWLLNVLNGTLDLRTGTLREHQRGDLNTKLAPVEYDPSAACPIWLAFLNTIFGGNQNLIYFIQKALGYALTGDVREQVLFFLYGPGGNGKSTLLNTVLVLLGDYAKQAAPELLTVKYGESHPTAVADLVGARFVPSIEVEQGKRLAEALVKQMTGGEHLKARYMRQNFFQFMPTHKIFLAANHKPDIRGTDQAIWRRIQLIPFTVTIQEAQRDRTLPDKLRAELSGILRWLVDGCLAWQREGLTPPTDVIQATDAYRAEMDVIGGFLGDKCVLGPRQKEIASNLYSFYQGWCSQNGEEPVKQRIFGQQLGERGFVRRRGAQGTHLWHGLKLR